jgi:hypothetical protein
MVDSGFERRIIMPRLDSLAVVAMALLCGVPATAVAQTRRALVIGIDKYPPSGRWQGLEGAVADADSMAGFLEANGFKVVRLLDSKATAEGIQRAFRETLIDPTMKGDLGVLYYAGHGSQVRNSLAKKIDKHDETIVPVDGKDIRSLDLGRWLEEAAGKGLRLSAIFDSCHSGGVTRGIAEGSLRHRSALADETDHPDASPRPDPAAAGVLMLYAARPEQLAQETGGDEPHGLFTSALLSVLSASAPDASAEQVFTQVHAKVKVAGRNQQDPVIDGKSDRREAPLFGPPVRGARGRPMVAAGAKVADGEVELIGGGAIGLAPGTTLVRPAVGKRPMVRLTVSKVMGPTRSLARSAEPADGPLDTVEPGDPFEVERFARVTPDPLRIEVGDVAPASKVAAWARALMPLRVSKKVYWVEDPASLEPTHLLFWRSGSWVLRGPDGREEALGELPGPGRLENRLAAARAPDRAAPCDARPCLFVRLPASSELDHELGWGRTATDPVAVALPGAAADYVLAGRVGEKGPEYALVFSAGPAGETFANGSDGLCSAQTPLPTRTDWVRAGGAAVRLDEFVAKLSRVKSWLTASPPDDGRFPYHLELRDQGKPVRPAAQGESDGGGTHVDLPRVKPGATLELWLVPDAARLAKGAAARFPYVFAIDCKGAIEIAYPPNGRGPVKLPLSGPDARPGQAYRLDEPVELDDTRGPYAFLLLVSSEPIGNVSAATQTGVRRGARAELTDDLGAYLGSFGTTRGINPKPLKVDWSVERVDFLVAPEVTPGGQGP